MSFVGFMFMFCSCSCSCAWLGRMQRVDVEVVAVMERVHAGSLENGCPPGKQKGERPLRAARREGHFCYWPVPLAAACACSIFFAISAFTASRLKLAPFCIGG